MKLEYIPTTCPYCGTGCGFYLKVRDGELVGVAPSKAHPNICDRLVYLSQPLPDNPDFLLYRLLGGLTEAINTCFWLHKDLLRKSLQENP